MPDIASALIAALGADRVRIGADIPERNRADHGGYPPCRPSALVLPRRTEEVATALRICHAAGVPVVTQGGLTGLAGGAHPAGDEVALSLERMTGVEEVDLAAGTLTALAGTPLTLVQEAAASAGLFYGVDLGARGSATIGGNVATNAGGNQVLRYGMTRAQLRGIEVVLADGEIVRALNKMAKNNTGLDLAQLFAGSEGTLGVITRVVVALQPPPGPVESALLAFDTGQAMLDTLARLAAAAPGALQVFEAMWRDFMDVAVGPMGLGAPFTPVPALTVLTELTLPRDRVEVLLAREIEAGRVRDALLARSEKDRARFWAYRESPYEYAKVLPPAIGFDVSFPVGVIDRAAADMRAGVTARFPEAIHVTFGHVADSNIHVNVALPGLDADKKHAIEEIVYGVVGRLGGSISAEHGIGRSKRAWLSMSRSPGELALMKRVKDALDPKGILNPGRVL